MDPHGLFTVRPSTFYIKVIKKRRGFIDCQHKGFWGGVVFALTCTLGDRLEAL